MDTMFGHTDDRSYDSPPTVIGTGGFYWPAGSIYSVSKKLPSGYYRVCRHSYTGVKQNSIEYKIYRLEDYKKFILSTIPNAKYNVLTAPANSSSLLSSNNAQELTNK